MNLEYSVREIRPNDRSIAFLIFGFLLACYLLTYTGVIQSSDGLAMFVNAESMVRRGELDVNQVLWMGLQQGTLGPDGDLYSRKGLGVPLLLLPLVWIAKNWPAIGLVQAALLLNPLLTAWTGALVYRSGRRLGWNRQAAVFTALIFGLGTLAWPYSQTLFSDPACGWGLFAGFYGLLSFGQTQRKRYLLGGGLAWSIAYLARPVNLLTLPIYLVTLIIVLRQQAAGRPEGQRFSFGELPALARENWRPLVSFLLPVVAAGLLSIWWNWARYGNPLESGYVETERFNAVWWFGVSGLLVGPARGLLWYSPVLLLAIPGAVWFWHHDRHVLGFVLTISMLYLLLYGKWYMWHGGYSWGPRFMVPMMPFLALLTGPAWAQLVQVKQWGLPGKVGAIALFLLSIAVQWLGMLVPFGLVQDWLAANYAPLFADETFTQPLLSPLILQWQFLTPENIHLAWWRAGESGQSIDWLGFAMPVVGILVGLVLVLRQVNYDEDPGEEGDRQNWLYGAALCFITLGMLTHYYTVLGGSDIARTAQGIESLERPADAILLLRPEQTQQFANAYHGELPVYGLVAGDSLDADGSQWMQRLAAAHDRLWVLPDYRRPEQSGWERHLRGHHFTLLDRRTREPDGQRLALYAMAGARPMVETGLGTVFGDPALVEQGISEANGWIRLNGYALTPEVRPGEEILLALRWESLQPVDYDYQVFVHLLNAADEKLAQRDGQPVQWLRPTSTWLPGEEIVDRYGLLLPADILAGEYTIAVGLYDPVTGQRLPVSAGPRDYAIELGPVYVER